LDFGFSKITKNSLIGVKEHTFFKGSMQFASEEMRNLSGKGESGFVDLHWNDLKGLLKSI